MTIEHKNIATAERHEPKGLPGASAGTTYVADGGGADTGSWTNPEPKGVSTALINKVYMADGAGSGDWRYFPHSHAYYSDTGGAGTTITTPTAYALIGPATVADADPHDFTHNSLGRLTYTGTDTIDGTATASLSFKHSTGSTIDCFFQLFKNGVALIGAEFVNTATSGNFTTITLIGHGTMATNDYLEVYCKCASGNIIVHALALDVDGRP